MVLYGFSWFSHGFLSFSNVFSYGLTEPQAPFLSVPAAAAALVCPRSWTRTREGLRRRLEGPLGAMRFDSERRMASVARGCKEVLVLHGSEDWKVPQEHGARLAELGGVRLHSFKCGHNEIVKQPGLQELLRESFESW